MTTQAGSGPAVELVGLTKRFRRALAVDHLSVEIARGSTFGLIGPNGAGKSTTIKMIMGLLRPTAGSAKPSEWSISSWSGPSSSLSSASSCAQIATPWLVVDSACRITTSPYSPPPPPPDRASSAMLAT